LGGFGALFGLAFIGLTVSLLFAVPWVLSTESPTVIATRVVCAPAGARYSIEVNGGRYLCGGGDSKCPDRPSVLVAYEPGNPNHCRVASNVDRPSLYELHALLFGLAWLVYAAAVFSWQPLEYLDRVKPAQSIAYRAAALTFYALLASMIAATFIYSRG
jgi:hypothetical protein